MMSGGKRLIGTATYSGSARVVLKLKSLMSMVWNLAFGVERTLLIRSFTNGIDAVEADLGRDN